jgi:hypothetical protein
MIFSANRCTPRIKCGAGFCRIMRYPLSVDAMISVQNTWYLVFGA